MILTDTGPLIALLDKDDSKHESCLAAARALPAVPLLTTWPCFTEAMYLLGAIGGYRYQSELWKLRQSNGLLLHNLTAPEIDRMAELMEKYLDRPMDVADGSLLAVAESLSLRQIFTVDTDFRFYRLNDGSVLQMIPGG